MHKISEVLEEISLIEKEILENDASKKIQQVNEFLDRVVAENIKVEIQAMHDEVEEIERELDRIKRQEDDLTRQIDEIEENRRRTEEELNRLEHTIHLEQSKLDMLINDKQGLEEEIQDLEKEIRAEEELPEAVDLELVLLRNFGIRVNYDYQKTRVESITMCSHNHQDIRTVPYKPNRPTRATEAAWNFISQALENTTEGNDKW
ncbi:hypothetical protein BDF20DRAFT_62114 [Mycotypha africana]|uniref:uncharacterized protein n=1 Tax=Mycotypha africana TaxID=64632 RepID=UPI002301F01F|nr:uncharacterized protein BDF20DRAFT_62114 [Mycotypha africana]KAI8991791.1 hypothetical protein BDF20DRAFT_62114 [Mycotypha africana]